MPSFKVKNLSISLGDQAQAGNPGLCLFPTRCNPLTGCNNPTFCFHPTDQCRPPTIINCWQGTVQCWNGTVQCLNNTCGIISPDPGCILSKCGVNFSTWPGNLEPLSPILQLVNDPAVLDVLQSQLDEAMVAIKDRGIELEKGQLPQSLAEAEALEKGLEEALAELKKIKKGL